MLIKNTLEGEGIRRDHRRAGRHVASFLESDQPLFRMFVKSSSQLRVGQRPFMKNIVYSVFSHGLFVDEIRYSLHPLTGLSLRKDLIIGLSCTV
jgi:hypothetical protein